MKKLLRFTKVFVALLMVMVLFNFFSADVLAASSVKGKTRTFIVRTSADYSKVGTVTIKATNASGTEGTITFNNDVYGTKKRAAGAPTTDGVYGFDRNQVYSYKISSMKDGGTITLKKKSGDIFWGVYSQTPYVGKIHINGSNTWSNIWKIDCLKYNNGHYTAGIYFRNN